MGGILFDFLPEMPDVSPQVFQLAAIFRPPYGLQQSGVRDGRIRVAHKIGQNVVLSLREMDFGSVFTQRALCNVQFQAAGTEDKRLGGFRAMCPAVYGAQSGEEFAKAERLGHIIVRARFQRLDLVFFLATNADHDDTGIGRQPPNAAAGFDPAHARHINIQQHEFGGAALELSQRGFAIGSFVDGKTGGTERGSQNPADSWFVIDN